MAKDIISAYRNVCCELQGLKAYSTILYNRIRASKSVVYQGKIQSSVMCYVPLDKAIDGYNDAVDDYNETIETIEQLESTKTQMEKLISSMSDLEQAIFILHVNQGMKLKDIADMSNYSYDHVRHVASRMKRKDRTKNTIAS